MDLREKTNPNQFDIGDTVYLVKNPYYGPLRFVGYQQSKSHSTRPVMVSNRDGLVYFGDEEEICSSVQAAKARKRIDDRFTRDMRLVMRWLAVLAPIAIALGIGLGLR